MKILLLDNYDSFTYNLLHAVKELGATDIEVVRNDQIAEIENKGMFNTIAQKVFGKPRFSKVHLDEMGTFIWPEIDGAKTVQELALLVKEHFGDKAEPLYPRIVKYFQIMESYEFVHFINKKTEK